MLLRRINQRILTMKIKEVLDYFEELVPRAYQESYDNSGLLVGEVNNELSSCLIALDCTEEIIDEAIKIGANLVVAHHPIIFGGLKSLTGKNYVERTVLKAIKNDVAIFVAHTNLDNVNFGVSKKICDKLQLQKTKVLAPKTNLLIKLEIYVPVTHSEMLRDELSKAGAGSIGDYDSCSFSVSGEGRFRAKDNAKPFVGELGKLTTVKELKVEVVFPKHLSNKILSVMKEVHPYEEVAYYLTDLPNQYHEVGSGMFGELKEGLPLQDFLAYLKEKMCLKSIRYTTYQPDAIIKKVAVCGGAGSFLLNNAKAIGADIFVTGDFKYHEFFDAEDDIVIADIGHYESEVFTKELFYELMTKKFPNIAVALAKTSTNPIDYYS